MPDLDALKSALMAATARANAAVAARLPLGDRGDFDAAARGKIAGLPADPILNAVGGVAWDMGKYDFLKGECPGTVNPSLWRMAQLNTHAGLFEVAEGVWQARGFDYANMTVIRGETGWILVDPLMAVQTSAAALKVVNETLGERPVSAVIVTHTHADHFGGLKGVVQPGNGVPIYAPAEFMEYAASEAIMGGAHFQRRAVYQFGLILREGPEGIVDGGIGKSVAKGARTFVEPTHYVHETGEEHLIDGVRFIFQMASGTEAPAEFTFMLPDHRVLCMAEVCTQTMHNVIPPRGAQARDARLWARTIDEAITRFADGADVLINCHNWPVFGREAVRGYLEEQRDLYKYLHDQVIRLACLGNGPHEVAATLPEPDWLSEKFHARGYYGSFTFNARSVYQFYYGWYDGNPVNLDPLAPEVLGAHVVEAIGGVDAAMVLAAQAVRDDKLQWAATLLSHVVFSGANSLEARAMLAEVLRHLGYRAESGIMRNCYLSGAQELDEGVKPLPMAGGHNSDLAATLSLRDWFDAYALRLNPDHARGVSLVLNLNVDGAKVCVSVARQTEFTRTDRHADDADATLTISQSALEGLAGGQLTLDAALAGGATLKGARASVEGWLAMHDTFEMWFNLVTP